MKGNKKWLVGLILALAATAAAVLEPRLLPVVAALGEAVEAPPVEADKR